MQIMIDKKVETIQEKYQYQMEETEQKLKQSLEKTVDKKIKQISVTVAKEVAEQILEVFRPYLPVKQITGHPSTLRKTIPMITQETPTLQDKNNVIHTMLVIVKPIW